MKTAYFEELKKAISTERKAINEINSSFNHLENATDKEEKKAIEEHVNRLKNSFRSEEHTSELQSH